MRIGQFGPKPRAVAVSATRDDAARVFGDAVEDLFLTTYAALAAEVDLTEVDVVFLGAGSGVEDAMPSLSERLNDDRRPLTLVVERSSGTDDALDRWRVGHGVRSVDRMTLGNREALVLRTGPEDETPSLPLVNGKAPAGSAAEKRDQRHAAEADPRPRPPLLHLSELVRRAARGPRRRLALLGLLALVVLLVPVVSVLEGGSWSTALLALVIAMMLATLLVLGVGVAVLGRQLHMQTGRLERMLRRQRVLLQRVEKGTAGLAASGAPGGFPAQLVEAMAEANASSFAELRESLAELDKHAEQLHLDTQRQVRALLAVQSLLPHLGSTPAFGGWAVSPDFMGLLLEELLELRPSLVVECGSGTSTLLLAMAIKQHGLDTRVVSLEHQERFKAETESYLRRYGVDDVVEVRLTELEDPHLEGHETRWYARSDLEGLSDVGLLVVDGPPAGVGKNSRYPAVPLLRERLAPRCTILVDDLVREQDHDVVLSWRDQLPDFTLEEFRTFQKGAGALRRSGETTSRP